MLLTSRRGDKNVLSQRAEFPNYVSILWFDIFPHVELFNLLLATAISIFLSIGMREIVMLLG